MNPIKDLHVTVQLRNNQLRERRELLGLNQRELCRAAGLKFEYYNAFECLRESPLGRFGTWKPYARRIAAFHGVQPEVLWPEAILHVDKNHAAFKASETELRVLMRNERHVLEPSPPPDRLLEQRQDRANIRAALDVLTPNERRVIEAKYLSPDADGDLSFDEVAEILGPGARHATPPRKTGRRWKDPLAGKVLSRERIRQLEASALGKLRKAIVAP